MLSFSFLSSKVWYGLLCVRGGIYRGAMFKFTLLIPANYPEGGCPVSVQKYPDFQLEKLSRERGDKRLRFVGEHLEFVCFACQLNNWSREHVPPRKWTLLNTLGSLWMSLVPCECDLCMVSAKLQELDFQAGVYHPLVNYETGELETKQEFQRWRYSSPSTSFLHYLGPSSYHAHLLPRTPLSLTHLLPHTPPSLTHLPPTHTSLPQTRCKSYLPVAHVCKEDILQH